MELIEHRKRRVDGGRIRLEGEVLFADGSREVIWFETGEAREHALNLGGDPWVVALAPLAVTVGEPLKVPLPVDPELREGLRTVARAWRTWDAKLHPLELEAPAAQTAPDARPRTGSLFSGGVDSWYTVLRNRLEADEGWVPRIDSLLLVWGADIALKHSGAFQALQQRLGRIACELSCELVGVATNLRETRWGVTDWTHLSHGSFFVSVAHACGEFRRLLIPSSVTYTNGRGWGSHHATDPLMSSRATRVIYDAADLGRIDKVELVSGSDIAMETLRVCWRSGSDQNCGNCMKCLRTMIALELNGALGRCRTFPSTVLDLAQVANLRAHKANEFRMLRNMSAAALVRGRVDLSRALQRAYDRSGRLEVFGGLLTRLDRIGLRGATRLRSWLEDGSIRN